MVESWFPLALFLALGGTFALWFAMDDYERSRYFAIIAGAPVTVFAVLGFLGK
jgi:hypothetical protein